MPDYSAPFEIERLRLLAGLIPEGHGRVAVDIGCFDGTTTRLIADRGYAPIGFDLDPSLVEQARSKHPDLDFRVGSVSDTQGIERALTVCLEVIEHLPKDEQAQFVADMGKAMAPGDLLLLSTPGRHSILSYYERLRMRQWRSYNWWDPTHISVMSARRLHRLLQPSFEVLSLTGFHYLPQEWVRPFAVSWRPLARAGFVLIVMARRRDRP